MYDYSRFSDADLKDCGANITALGAGSSNAVEPFVGDKVFA